MNKQFFKDKLLNSDDVMNLETNFLNLVKKVYYKITKFHNQKTLFLLKILNQNLLNILQKKKKTYFLNKIKIQNKREYGSTWHRDSGRPHQYKLISKKIIYT